MIKQIVTFFVGAGLAAFGMWLLVFSGDFHERTIGLFISVVSGLGAVVIPILMAMMEREHESK